MTRLERTLTSQRIRLERRLPSYWRVTFDHPPLNIFGPDSIPQLNAIISALETDEQVKVVVFDSAVEGFFLTHYDFLAPLEDSTSIPPGPTGLQALPDMLVRLSRAAVVSIASIRGRATGVGSELALASDMRFASREKRHSFPMGGRCRPRARWRTDGAIASPGRTRTRAGDSAQRG
jgi:enoyl-CoA hydratase/carnithine racemase